MTKPRQPRTKSSPFFIEPFSVSVAGAAAYTGLSEDTIKRACRDRKLSHRDRLGRGFGEGQVLSDAAESGDVTRAIQNAIADGAISAGEKDNILRQLEERDESSRRVRAALATATSKKKGKGK